MKGFVGTDYQSANTLRNSLSPISIGKQERFKAFAVGGSQVPFHDVKAKVFEIGEEKIGWGFGYTKRKVFDQEKIAYIPSPDTYYGPWMSSFNKTKPDFKKCTFGETYDKIRARVEIENKAIHTQIQFEKVGPVSYTPLTSLTKKTASTVSCATKLPLLEEQHRLSQPHVSPERYTIKDELVKQTRFTKILAGGTMPKEGFQPNKNPGPGEYTQGNSISDIANSKAKTQSSSFASTMGKSWYSHQVSPSGSPRACAFATPHSGEPFNDFGFIKAHNHQYHDKQSLSVALATAKCQPPSQKTQELLDFLRMNDRILRFKKRTIRNIDEALNNQVRHRSGSQYI